jgi:hypothetical protein
MRSIVASRSGAFVLLFLLLANATVFAAKPGVELRLLGTRSTGLFDEAAAEIVAHDPISQRLFVRKYVQFRDRRA